MRRRIILSALVYGFAVLAMPATAPRANAQQASPQFFGGIVFDPKNYGQNLLSAIRSLRQINNQISQLQNQARMLVNGARNLVRLPFSVRNELAQVLGEISTLMNEARSLSYSIQQTERSFQALYPKTYANWSSSQIASATQQQWQNSRAAFVDALLMQSKIVETIEKDAGLLDQLVGQSQSAPGSLSAAQAGNQIMALSAKQAMQMQQLMATQFRAEMLERARQLAVEREGVERHKRFVGSASAYGSGQGN